MNKKLLRTGMIGTIVALVCCFSPALVIGLTAIGLAAAIAWLDYVVLPALVVFIGITLYALASGKQKEHQ